MRAALLIILAALAAIAQDRQPGKGVNVYSLEKESALGASLAAEITRQATPIDSLVVRDFVNAIGDRLSAQIPGAPFPYTFTVIAGDSGAPGHEPVAVPFQRAQETQADALAINITSKAGFDPSALVRYIGREQVSKPGTVATVFATLPSAEMRVSAMQSAILALPPQTYPIPSPDEFDRIQTELRRVMPVAETPQLKPPLKRGKA